LFDVPEHNLTRDTVKRDVAADWKSRKLTRDFLFQLSSANAQEGAVFLVESKLLVLICD